MLMKSENPLENELFKSVYEKTPDYIKNLNLMDFSNDNEFTFILKKEHLKPYDEKTNPEGLNLEEWFAGYAKEAKVSTAGIRVQNILNPQDTRFPINLVGIVLATLAKALVAKEKYPNKRIVKVADVRCAIILNYSLMLLQGFRLRRELKLLCRKAEKPFLYGLHHFWRSNLIC